MRPPGLRLGHGAGRCKVRHPTPSVTSLATLRTLVTLADIEALFVGAGEQDSVSPATMADAAEGLNAAVRQLLAIGAARTAAPSRSEVRRGLLKVVAAGTTLLIRCASGRAVGRQVVGWRRAWTRLGGFGVRALADAAAGDRPLAQGMDRVSAAAAATMAPDAGSHPGLARAVADLVEWAQAASTAYQVTQPERERPGDPVRRFAFAALEIIEHARQRPLRLARRTYATDDADAGEPYGPAISYLESIFALLRRLPEVRAAPVFGPLLSPSNETLAAWIRGWRGGKWKGNKRLPTARKVMAGRAAEDRVIECHRDDMTKA